MERNKVRRMRRGGVLGPGLEGLEERELLSFSPLGFSLPDLTVTGVSAPVAAYGGTLTVSVDVRNLGASSITEPYLLSQGAPSAADAPPSEVAVFLGRGPQRRGPLVPLGTIPIPAVAQNSLVTVTQTLPMPDRPGRLPGLGQTAYVYFRIDPAGTIIEHDRRNNFSRRGAPVNITVDLPDLYAVALDVPTVMQPGDVIAPTIRVANFGAANPSEQGTFLVQLVASTDQDFGPGDSVLDTFTISSLPPLAAVPMRNTVLGDVDITPPINIITLQSTTPVALPTQPGRYFIGVVVDPQQSIQEIEEVGLGSSTRIDPIRRVGPPDPAFPPAGVLPDPNPAIPATGLGNQFPVPASGFLIATPGIFPPPATIVDAATGAAVTPTSTSSSGASSAQAQAELLRTPAVRQARRLPAQATAEMPRPIR